MFRKSISCPKSGTRYDLPNITGNQSYVTVSEYVAFEGFVLYSGGDYTVYPNIMLLVQVMAYVMSGTLASDKVRHLTCAPEPGPLIGSPIRTIRPGLRRQGCRRVSLTLSS